MQHRAADFLTSTPAETAALAERLGCVMRAGDTVLLAGDLGAGKTTFAQGLARGLGCRARVTSPTFVLMNRYSGRIPLIHVDLYRLPPGAELEDLGLWEAASETVLAIEWPGRAAHDALPADAVRVTFAAGPTEGTRAITITATGPRSAAVVAALRAGQ
jgi:tRNA threonylcarbamoyladenosine biosynthesis protein TsaE